MVVKRRLRGGQTAVEWWSSGGREVVKEWSNVVKEWSNVVKEWSNDLDADVVLAVERRQRDLLDGAWSRGAVQEWSNNGQRVVQEWSNNGQRVVQLFI